MVKWLRVLDYDQHSLGLNPTCIILLCPSDRHFVALSPHLTVLATSSKFQSYLYKIKNTNKKFQTDSNILISQVADQNCFSYV